MAALECDRIPSIWIDLPSELFRPRKKALVKRVDFVPPWRRRPEPPKQ